jgi:hypothetical protein
MLYDVTRSASDNRPPGIPLDDEINVGRAVYPMNIQTTDSNVGIPESEITNVSLDMFSWAPDSSKFVFGAQHQLPQKSQTNFRGIVDLVMVHPSHDKPTVKIFPAIPCGRSTSSCTYHLDDVEFGEDGINAHFGDFGQKQSVQVKYDQFR